VTITVRPQQSSRVPWLDTRLTANVLSIEQIGHAVGYTNRGSFFRAFRQVHRYDPSGYRAARPRRDLNEG
jgi:transcriptional regulator GlxA family with amidase domain